ncbi:uncharacterized protein LOC130137467 [Syzygium oleosum]|uniref:uncharacterized protein LOC130137467 n=1 Tax=Syzygium oleosum TaxID=219896 RepID=UPI0024BA2A30|nr:uncharacterized protein LOC130137467 [Syzygium oleosum]
MGEEPRTFDVPFNGLGDIDPQCADGDLANPEASFGEDSDDGHGPVIWEADESDPMDEEPVDWDSDPEPMDSDGEPEPMEQDPEPEGEPEEGDSEDESAEAESELDSIDSEAKLSDSSSESSGSDPDWVP